MRGEWRDYEFHYKLGRTDRIAPIVMPHQPRFDWQLWFSALSTYETEYYLMHFLYKLMNNDTVAYELLANDPFNG
jgi:hypothetical protein